MSGSLGCSADKNLRRGMSLEEQKQGNNQIYDLDTLF